MAVHFCPAFWVISVTRSLITQVEQLGPGLDVGADHDGVEAVGLEVDPGPGGDHARVGLDRGPDPLRAGERDHVLGPDVVEQVAGRAHQQLEAALGDAAVVEQQREQLVGQPRGAGRGLADHRHPGEQRDRGLAEHAPGREVERVDVDGQALARDQHVLGPDLRAAEHLGGLVLDDPRLLAQALGQVGVVGEHRDAAVDVELGVLAGVAAVLDGDLDQLLAGLVEDLGHALEQRPALGEGQLAQVGATDLAAALRRPRRSDAVIERMLASSCSVAGFISGRGLPSPDCQASFEVTVELRGHGQGIAVRLIHSLAGRCEGSVVRVSRRPRAG